MKIEHMALNVSSAAEHVKWYVDHLGMQVVRKMNDPNQTHFLADEAGQTVIELYSNPAMPVLDYAAMNALTFHIAFVVENIKEDFSRLAAAGASVDSEIRENAAGDLLAMLRDPWGIPIQLVQRHHALLQARND
ncbi:MAG TPA: VOC family protein [Aggregatilineales bacterium]|nr:VOC family protein [Aggregatilineales bacterium]